MQTILPKKNVKTLLWNDAASIALANQILTDYPTCLVIFTGRKIIRKILKREKEIFRDCGFQLLKVNKFCLEGALNLIFWDSQKYFSNTICGYSLIAFSGLKRYYTPQEILSLFNFPSYYTIPMMVFANQTLYTMPRLAAQNYFQEMQNYSLATNLGILCVFFWLIQMQTVIQSNIILLKQARPY